MHHPVPAIERVSLTSSVDQCPQAMSAYERVIWDAIEQRMGDIDGATILDLGSGDGRFARRQLYRGAYAVDATEISRARVDKLAASTRDPHFHVHHVDVTRAPTLPADSHDYTIAISLFDRLASRDMVATLRWLRARTRRGQWLMFAVLHPCWPFFANASGPVGAQADCVDYLSCDATMSIRMPGASLAERPEALVHKSWGTYYDVIRRSGWTRIAEIKELCLPLGQARAGHAQDVPVAALFTFRGTR
jgi:SAM-dependent methyltransferase